MRSMPNDAAVLDDKSLRRFVTHTEPFGDRVGQAPVFNYPDGAANKIIGAFDEGSNFLIGLRADRTLRAMLENNNGIDFRPVQ